MAIRDAAPALSFFSIAAAACSLSVSATPTGPWEGLYRSYPMVWVFLSVGGIFLLLAAMGGLEKHRYLVFTAVPLYLMVVASLTLQWGVPFGIRDPWMHLYYTKSNVFFGENPYPFLHYCLAVASQVTGVSVQYLLSRVQVIAPAIGVVWIGAVAHLLDRNHWHLSVVAISPAVFIWLISRPYSVGPLFVTLLWWVIFKDRRSRRIQSLLLLLMGTALFYHPIAGILAGVVMGSGIVYTSGARFSLLNRRLKQTSPPGMLMPCIILGLLGVVHFLYFTPLLERLLVRASLAIIGATQTSGSVGAGGGSVLAKIAHNPVEFLLRGLFVISIGVVVFASGVVDWYHQRVESPTGVSILAVCGTVFIFVLISIAPGTLFGIRRAMPLPPLLFVPAFVIAIRNAPISGWRIAGALLVLSAGLATTYSSPLVGGSETGTVKADLASVDWIHEHHGEKPVVGSENTLYIALGKYGKAEVRDLVNNHRFRYQSVIRPEEFSWEVPPPDSGAYYAVSEQARRRAGGSPWVSFTRSTPRVYDNGGVRYYLQTAG